MDIHKKAKCTVEAAGANSVHDHTAATRSACLGIKQTLKKAKRREGKKLDFGLHY